MLPKEWLEQFDAKCAKVEKAYEELFVYAATLPTNSEIKEDDKAAILKIAADRMTELHHKVLT